MSISEAHYHLSSLTVPGQATTAPASVKIFLSCLEVDVEEEDIRVQFVAELPRHLTVQLAQVVGHHQRRQTDKFRVTTGVTRARSLVK